MSLREQLIAKGAIRPARTAEPPIADEKATPTPEEITVTVPRKSKSRKFRNMSLQEKIAIRQANRKETPTQRCPLCGQHVADGKLLQHKAAMHNEKEITPSPCRTAAEPPPARFVPGGATGLKRK